MNNKQDQRDKNHSIICRQGFEEALIAEADAGGYRCMQKGTGWITISGNEIHPEFIFEAHRFIQNALLPNECLKPIEPATAQTVFSDLANRVIPWSVECHTVVADQEDRRMTRRLEGIKGQLLKHLKRMTPELYALHRSKSKPNRYCLILFLTKEGLLSGFRESGGFHSFRMKMDPMAPSRSYMKIEEAFCRMNCYPQTGDHVIDLGAAPGGWTYAFLKRGANILAVDHGPLKLKAPGTGQVQHVKANGITFEPPGEWDHIDWLVGDMLVDPGTATGLIGRWMNTPHVKRIVCNIKIPQKQPYSAIQPLLNNLKKDTGWRCILKQLYHDRREVTLMAVRT